MSKLKFEELNEKNIYEAINVCNASLQYDSFTVTTMRRISLQDPNLEAGLALVAYEGEEPLGVVIGCRRTKQPSELVDPVAGWIKLLAGIAGKEVDEFGVLNSVCERVETELAKLGAKVIRVSDMASWHMWPGIDLRYETILEVLERRGYTKVGQAVDYLVNLRNFTVPRRIIRIREELSKKGISISLAKREERKDLSSWVKTKFGPGWAFEVETSLTNTEERRSGTIIARDMSSGEIIGFSTYGALEWNWFGPIGVDEKRRNSGLGSVLLFESLKLMRLNGVIETVIPWTGHLFFYTQVPGIVGIRHYQIMSKRLD
ncbi:MAG: hypothetical protein ACUVTL_02910 [Thermoproteota archaeon]